MITFYRIKERFVRYPRRHEEKGGELLTTTGKEGGEHITQHEEIGA